MNEHQLSNWVRVVSQQAIKSNIFDVLQKSRNLVGALLLSAFSLSSAQDKPYTISDDVNFWSIWKEHTVLPSDPSPNVVWHKSLDTDVSLAHIGTRWEVDDGKYISSGIHWWADNYSFSAHYVSNLYPDRPFEWHAIRNEIELRWLFLHQLNSKTQLQWWVWAFTEQPLVNTHGTSTHTSEIHDAHDSHDSKKVENHLDTHDSGHHERLTIIAPTLNLQHKFSDRLRLLVTGSAGFDMKWLPHALSSVEILGTVFETRRLALVYNLGMNHATWIGTSFEWSTGVVFSNRERTWRFFFVGDLNYNLRNDQIFFWLRTGFSFNLERGHY